MGWIPSVIYRITFKATMVAYAPFIWVTQLTLLSPLSLKARLERITKGELEKARRWFAALILSMLAAKAGLFLGWIDRSGVAKRYFGEKLVGSLMVPEAMPWWHLTLATDALLTFVLLYFADAALSRLDSPQAWPQNVVTGLVSSVAFVRSFLALATMAYFFSVALAKVLADPMLGLFVA